MPCLLNHGSRGLVSGFALELGTHVRIEKTRGYGPLAAEMSVFEGEEE